MALSSNQAERPSEATGREGWRSAWLFVAVAAPAIACWRVAGFGSPYPGELLNSAPLGLLCLLTILAMGQRPRRALVGGGVLLLAWMLLVGVPPLPAVVAWAVVLTGVLVGAIDLADGDPRGREAALAAIRRSARWWAWGGMILFILALPKVWGVPWFMTASLVLTVVAFAVASLLGESWLLLALVGVALLHFRLSSDLFTVAPTIIAALCVTRATTSPWKPATLALPLAMTAFVTMFATSDRSWSNPFVAGALLAAAGVEPVLELSSKLEGVGLWRALVGFARSALDLVDRIATRIGAGTARTVGRVLHADLDPAGPSLAGAAAEHDGVPTLRRDAAELWKPALVWLAGQVVVWRLLPPTAGRWRTFGQWDTFIFLDIAKRGPQYPASGQPTVTSFPGYPMAIRALEHLTSDPLKAAIAASMLFGLLALVLLWLWLGRMAITGTARWCAVLLLALFPYAFFLYGIAYSDGMFLALALGCVLLVELRRPVLAGLVGALATASRPTGLALLAGIVFLQAERSGLLAMVRPLPRLWGLGLADRVRTWRRGLRARGAAASPRPAQLGVLLAALGVGGYALYSWRRWGDPIAFWTAQKWYGHSPATAAVSWNKQVYVTAVWRHTWPATNVANTSAQLVLTILAALAIPAIAKRFGFGYGVLMACVVIQTWLGDSIFSVGGRYLMAAFPLFAIGGVVLARRPPAVRVGVLVAFAVFAMVMARAFTRAKGYPIW